MEKITKGKFSVIITAAGSGKRFSTDVKKQFCELNGKPILSYALSIFFGVKGINEIIITLPPDSDEVRDALTTGPDAILPSVKFIHGGATRQISVFNALSVCDKTNDFVIIHDGVRPFFHRIDLKNMLSLMSKHNAVIAASKVKHTIKRVKSDKIIETIPRDDLIEVYTPQIFKLKMIKDLHNRAKDLDVTFTDDASICEYFKKPVYWYETTSPSLKITTQEDLLYAEHMLSRR